MEMEYYFPLAFLISVTLLSWRLDSIAIYNKVSSCWFNKKTTYLYCRLENGLPFVERRKTKCDKIIIGNEYP